MKPDFYDRLKNFFIEWSCVMIIAFIESEKEYINKGGVLRTLSSNRGKSDKERLLQYIESEDYIARFGELFHDDDFVAKSKYMDEDTFINWLRDDYKYIMLEMQSGYANDLLISPLYVDLSEFLHNFKLLINSNDIQSRSYSEWRRNYRHSTLLRKDLVCSNENVGFYLYERFCENELLCIMFDGLNGGRLTNFYDEIVDNLIKHDIFDDVCEIYLNECDSGLHRYWFHKLFKSPDGKKINTRSKSIKPETYLFKSEDYISLKRSELEKYVCDKHITGKDCVIQKDKETITELTYVALGFKEIWEEEGIVKSWGVGSKLFRFLTEVCHYKAAGCFDKDFGEYVKKGRFDVLEIEKRKAKIRMWLSER